MNDLRLAFGKRLKELRERADVSQEELADRAHVHWTYLSDLERGQQAPTLDVVNRLARALDVTLASLFSPFDQHFRMRFRKPRQDQRRTR